MDARFVLHFLCGLGRVFQVFFQLLSRLVFILTLLGLSFLFTLAA